MLSPTASLPLPLEAYLHNIISLSALPPLGRKAILTSPRFVEQPQPYNMNTFQFKHTSVLIQTPSLLMDIFFFSVEGVN
jgi:hypothetical protein